MSEKTSKPDVAPTSFKLERVLMRRFRVACASRDIAMTDVLRSLIEAWLEAIQNDPDVEARSSQIAEVAVASTPKSKEVADLRELVEEFIRFASEPSVEDRNWSRHTLALLRERISARRPPST